MKFKCNACGEIIYRDMRFKMPKILMTKRGYRSYCTVIGRTVQATRPEDLVWG